MNCMVSLEILDVQGLGRSPFPSKTKQTKIKQYLSCSRRVLLCMSVYVNKHIWNVLGYGNSFFSSLSTD